MGTRRFAEHPVAWLLLYRNSGNLGLISPAPGCRPFYPHARLPHPLHLSTTPPLPFLLPLSLPLRPLRLVQGVGDVNRPSSSLLLPLLLLSGEPLRSSSTLPSCRPDLDLGNQFLYRHALCHSFPSVLRLLRHVLPITQHQLSIILASEPTTANAVASTVAPVRLALRGTWPELLPPILVPATALPRKPLGPGSQLGLAGSDVP